MNPLAIRLAGTVKASTRSGRKQGEHSPAYGPMSITRVSSLLVLLLALHPALAQQPTPPAAAPPSVPESAPAEAPARPEWRDISGYRFPALARTVADMQFLAHAMQLREFCANARVPDDFVRERLDRFGAMTGRKESCATLLSY